MRKLAVLLLLLPSFLYSQDFRNAYWGSTIEKVRKTEKKVDWVSLGKEDKIAFKTYVNNFLNLDNCVVAIHLGDAKSHLLYLHHDQR